jgi:hypothetical protein
MCGKDGLRARRSTSSSHRLALDKRQARDVSTIEMQEDEGVVDKEHAALAVGRHLV